MDYEKEYKGLVNELVRHFYPAGRMVAMKAYYRTEDDPCIKLSESPFIYKAMVAAGAEEGPTSSGHKTIRLPYGKSYLVGIDGGE